MSYDKRIILNNVAIHQVIVASTAQVQLLICRLDFLTGDTDIIQSLSRRGVVEHLLQKQELTAIIMGHNHLVVAEGLAERMGGHLDIDIKLGCNTLEDTVNGFDAQGFIEVETLRNI